MLDEGIRAMKLLWQSATVDFQGRCYSLERAIGHPRPKQHPHPPIVVGGLSQQLLAIAARHADEWNLYGQTPSAYHRLQHTFEGECQVIGRDPAEIRHSIVGPVAIARSSAAYKRRAAALLQIFPLRKLVPPDGRDASPGAMRALGWFAGSPSDVAEQVAAFADAGVDRIIFQHLDLGEDESLELLAEISSLIARPHPEARGGCGEAPRP
jgi:alkanesulfonate monooxygenase SsuD/methylene tetrahydromethanopterin reductase-like flavin-dependent oxidoreductase (luciferase family)